MLKKFILASAILAATSTVALANGPYIGGSVGVNSGSFTVKNSDFGSKADLGGRNAIANLFAGYGTMVNQNVYLGGEVFADLTSTSSEVKVNATNQKDSVTQRYGYGISFIPGVMLSDHTMAFARAGVVRSRFEAKESQPVSVTQRKNLTGGQVGLGLQTSLTQNLDLRGEYDYTRYREANFNGDKLKPSADSFNLGLVYKFD